MADPYDFTIFLRNLCDSDPAFIKAFWERAGNRPDAAMQVGVIRFLGCDVRRAVSRLPGCNGDLDGFSAITNSVLSHASSRDTSENDSNKSNTTVRII